MFSAGVSFPLIFSACRQFNPRPLSQLMRGPVGPGFSFEFLFLLFCPLFFSLFPVLSSCINILLFSEPVYLYPFFFSHLIAY